MSSSSKKRKSLSSAADDAAANGAAAALSVAPAKTSHKEKKAKKEKKSSSSRKKADESDSSSEVGDVALPVMTKSNGESSATTTPNAAPTVAIKTTPLSKFPLSPATVAALEHRGITSLFEVQAQTFNDVIAGHDMMVKARTGSGKTLAFALPTLEKLLAENAVNKPGYGALPRVIVLAPTRELAKQIASEFESCSRVINVTAIYGGTPYGAQESALRRGIDVVIGTPGRVMDLLEKNMLKVDKVHTVILDEADEMLNMGFQQDVEDILGKLPAGAPRQTLLFSATIPRWVESVVRKHLKPEFKSVDVARNEETPKRINHFAINCPWQVRDSTLPDIVRVYGAGGRSLVFCQTKQAANELAMRSSMADLCQVLHGDIPQAQREATMEAFRASKFPVLVATDVAARGIDIPELDLVVLAQPPARARPTCTARAAPVAPAATAL
jgi:ATP-dependent RNA helicase DDX21